MVKKIDNGHCTHYFSVSMNYAECEALYQHHIAFIVVTSTTGKRIRLPKHNIRQFISPSGLHGHYELIIDQNNKIVSIKSIK